MAVSGGAHRTWRATPRAEAEDEARLVKTAGHGAVMVQPLLDEIAREGEWSLLFFHGCYSHAVLERPRAGDFRVQREHGGSVSAAEPSREMISAADRALDAILGGAGPPLDARVDGCMVGGDLRLMELELLEPELFLRCAAEAPGRLADAVLSRLA
jgi:hypothetical protein